MRIVEPSATVLWEQAPQAIMEKIERAGRTAYKSEGKIGPGTADRFVRMLVEHGHESVIEHVSVSAMIVCDRGVSHELVRHRIASYTQESTRYCSYADERFDGSITVVRPSWFTGKSCLIEDRWASAMAAAESTYFALLANGCTPQEARSVLPNSLKTEVFTTFNLREWRHFFRLRCAPAAHPDMRVVAKLLYNEFSGKLPVLFPVEGLR